MTEHTERRGVPLSWCLAAFAAVLSVAWVVLVSAGPWIAAVVTLISALIAAVPLLRSALALVVANTDGIWVGEAHLESEWIGDVDVLHGPAWTARTRQGDHHTWLSLRNHHDGGIVITNTDPDDPMRTWLVSSTNPQALAAAMGHTGSSPDAATDTTPEGT